MAARTTAVLPKTTAKAFRAIAVAAAADGTPTACWSGSNLFARNHALPPTTPRAAAIQSMSESSGRRGSRNERGGRFRLTHLAAGRGGNEETTAAERHPGGPGRVSGTILGRCRVAPTRTQWSPNSLDRSRLQSDIVASSRSRRSRHSCRNLRSHTHHRACPWCNRGWSRRTSPAHAACPADPVHAAAGRMAHRKWAYARYKGVNGVPQSGAATSCAGAIPSAPTEPGLRGQRRR